MRRDVLPGMPAPVEEAVRSGVCRNAPDCAKAVTAEALEWYPGPGEYCPECGEPLLQVEPNISEPPARAPRAFETHPRRRAQRASLVPLVVVPLAIVVTFAAAIGLWQFLPAKPVAAATVHVCSSSVAERFAADLVHGFVAKSGTARSRFELTATGPCDVRLFAISGNREGVIAHDGIVAVVNPRNPIARLSEKQIRAIYAGAIRDWSQVGGSRGNIVAVLPGEATDEAKAIDGSLLYGARLSRRVHRSASSAAIVRAVVSSTPGSRDVIGLVALSAAAPAKVLTLAYLPSPSARSIAERRYPYALSIVIEPGEDKHGALADGFMTYAQSTDAQPIVARDGLVARRGP